MDSGIWCPCSEITCNGCKTCSGTSTHSQMMKKRCADSETAKIFGICRSIDRKLRLHAVVPKRGERLLYCDYIDRDGEGLFRLACEHDQSWRSAGPIRTCRSMRSGSRFGTRVLATCCCSGSYSSASAEAILIFKSGTAALWRAPWQKPLLTHRRDAIVQVPLHLTFLSV
jgi:hypothetical protein